MLIKGYIAEAKRRTEKKVIFWRTDGGGCQFINKTLKTYFAEKGILVQKTQPYAHEQNGKLNDQIKPSKL